jgi:hypothetical protein
VFLFKNFTDTIKGEEKGEEEDKAASSPKKTFMEIF